MIAFSREQMFLVTGASSGIGRAIALHCNAMGASVIANGRDLERLAAVKAESADPSSFHLAPRDLAEDMDALPGWVKELREKYGKLSGLVSCAGYSFVQTLREYTKEAAQGIFDIHFHAPMLLARGFADKRNNAGPGSSIIFLSSGGAFARVPGLALYGAAKGAVITATGVLSKELAPQKIRVNTLAPGLVHTPMGDSFLEFIGQDAREKELALYPFGLGMPSDVSNMAVFLLSNAARWITGQTIVLDGGRY